MSRFTLDPIGSEDQQLLDEVGALHRAEHAPEAFRQHLLARLRQPGGATHIALRTSGRRSFRALAAWGTAAVSVAAGLVLLLGIYDDPAAGVVVGAEPGGDGVGLIGSGKAAAPDLLESRLAFAHGCPRNPSAENTALTDPDVIQAGLTVHTFETDTPSCGTIVRRYLAYVPSSLPREARAPVLIVLHGGPDRAENMRSIQTQRRFETLAAREGFIVVYASAVATKDSDPLMQNEGRWRTHGYIRPEVDDEVYLLRIVEDLLTRRVIDGTNPVFLVGHAEGANMALQAAAYRPDFYSGVAAFMPYEMGPPFPSQDVRGARLSRVLFVVLDGGGTAIAKSWALGLGVPPEAVEAPRDLELPNRVVEGKSHAHIGAVARGTRNSTVRRVDWWSAKNAQRAVRVFDIKHGGIFWPTPAPNDDERLIRDFGFRNQDIDGAEETWKFLSGAEPRVPDAFAEDEDVVLDTEAVRETPW